MIYQFILKNKKAALDAAFLTYVHSKGLEPPTLRAEI